MILYISYRIYPMDIIHIPLITYDILRSYDIPPDFHFNRSDEYITTNTEPTL